MKILVTGAGGFIGSHLTEKCVEQCYDVRAFIHYNSRNAWGWLENSPYRKDIEVVTGSIRDNDSVYSSLKGCDTVLHLAALIGIPYSYISPKAYIETNIEGTYNILQGSRELGLSNVLVTSTSETYGTAQYVPIDELHPAVGQSPYSATKIAADQLAVSYHKSFGLPVKIVRPFNTYGPRQSSRAFIPTIITQILSGKKEIHVGNLTPTRDLTFVKDTAKGFLELLKIDGLWGEATNIGMNEEIAMGDLAHLISRLIGEEIILKTDEQRVRPGDSEVERLMCNNTKISTSTNWKPDYTLESGLMETIEWMKDHLKLYKPEIYNV